MRDNTVKPDTVRRRRRQIWRKRLWHSVLHVALLLSGIVFVAPFLWTVVTSLKVSAQIFTWPPIFIPQPIQWRNYYDAMTFVPFGRYFLNSLFLCLIVAIGTLLSNTLVAYGFARIDWIGRDVVFILVLSTIMLPSQVTMIPVYIIFRNLGWIGGFLPLTVPAFAASAYFTFLLRQFFRTIPFELSDAARIDGCSELGILRYVILPLSKPALTTVALFTFIGTWNDFLGPLIYLHDQKLYTVALGLQQFQSRYVTPINQLMAASTVAIIPVLIVFLLAQRMFIEGITITGMSGR